MAGWYYTENKLLGGEEHIGPISGDSLLQLAQDGTLKQETMVSHQKHTRGKWVSMGRIPIVRKKYDAGLRQRQAEKAEEKAQRAQAKVEKEDEERRRKEDAAEALENS